MTPHCFRKPTSSIGSLMVMMIHSLFDSYLRTRLWFQKFELIYEEQISICRVRVGRNQTGPIVDGGGWLMS